MSLFNHLTYSSLLTIGAGSAVALAFGAPLIVGAVGIISCVVVIIAVNQ